MRLSIYIDGGSRGNPGPAAVGIVIHCLDRDAPIHEAGYFLGRKTNNEAEYEGLLRAVRIAGELGAAQIVIHSDSQLMVRQLNGDYKVKSPSLIPLFQQARRQLQQFDDFRVHYVPRRDNHRADEMVNKALDAGRDVIELALDQVPSAQPAPPAPAPAATHEFTLEFFGDPGADCPAKCEADARFTLGAVVPAGLCTYGAKAVFDAVSLDPPTWSAEARCERCGVSIQISAIQ